MRTLMTMFAVATIVAVATFDLPAGEVKKPSQRWTGKSGDESLIKLAPKSGYLTDQKSFETLWTGWKVKGEAPKIDFAKSLVIVHLGGGGPNIPSASYTLDEKGELRAKVAQTLIAGPGFGYAIDVLPREGIKLYKGKPLE